jgi:hypothetical protein
MSTMENVNVEITKLGSHQYCALLGVKCETLPEEAQRCGIRIFLDSVVGVRRLGS